MANLRTFLKRFPLLAVFALALSLAPQAQAAPLPVQGPSVTAVAPLNCPSSGCAAGQRLSYSLDFDLGAYDPAQSPNVKFCVYAPTGWFDPASVNQETSGRVTGVSYTPAADCAEDPIPPTGYTLVSAAYATFTNYVFADSLGLSLRLSSTTTTTGKILLRIFERSAASWSRSQQAFTGLIYVAPLAPVLYVAADASACNTAGVSPCYLNSADDLANGLGTGLRDAVEAAAPASTIQIIGTYPLKGSTVTIDKTLLLQGSTNSVLTANSPVCSNPMLNLTAGGTLRGLILNDGGCTTVHRDLISVNSPADVLIESNTLTGGKDAIRITDNSGSLTVRYNQISANSGYGLFWDTTTGSAALNLVANNIFQNRGGDDVECAAGSTAPIANRNINHNYWGVPSQPSSTTTHCTISTGRNLGAAAALNPSGAGVSAVQAKVTNSKTYAFDNQIAFQRSSEGSDYDLYIINHGSSLPDSIPFTNSLAGSPSLCSSAFDIFLADGATATGTLTLSFKYNRSSACIAAVESSQFCEQTTATASVKYPLWWYDPAGNVTSGWDTTGQKPAGTGASGAAGQTTTCDMAQDEIRVALSASGRPGLSDINYLPFLVGLPIPNSFRALASNQTITLQWSTISEADVTGYYVLRSMVSNSGFDPISDLIARKGSALSGGDYSFVDGGRTNGVTNYYRLKIVHSDGGYTYSDIAAIVPNVPTATPSPTPTRTYTPRPTFTATRPFYTATRFTFGNTATRFVTATGQLTATRAGTVTLTPNAMTRTVLATQGTFTPTASSTPTPYTGTPPASPTPTTLMTATPAFNMTIFPTATPLGSATPAKVSETRTLSGWVSLILGFLLSSGLIGGLGWWAYRKRILS